MGSIAYFSAEIGISSALPTYSGGLGILAGDHLKAAADLSLPLVGITLLYREGYGLQRLDQKGNQSFRWTTLQPEGLLEDTGIVISLPLEGRQIHAKLWRKEIIGQSGYRLPIIFLDTHHEANSPEHQALANQLYGGDELTRLHQEYLLGVGGVQALQQLGHAPLQGIHLNEGHTAFALLALLAEGWSREELAQRSLFTSHTPVRAGHDIFHYSIAHQVLGDLFPSDIRELAGPEGLSMSQLAASLSGHHNGVSQLNARVAQRIFINHTLEPLTNGVHHQTWVVPALQQLFDAHLPGWREDPQRLEGATGIPSFELRCVHQGVKERLLEYVNGETAGGLSPELLTVGFARRMAPYKRADLIFKDMDRLAELCQGRVQFLFAGKAHPRNLEGHKIIRRIFEASENLKGRVPVVFLENYNMWQAQQLVGGVDIWLNTPVRPLEACGTSGMKAALNGGLNLSILDGWWAEACDHGRNGWAIGEGAEQVDDQLDGQRDDARDAALFYEVLEKEVLPVWENDAEAWSSLMQASIATGARFTAQRMVNEYQERFYSRFGGTLSSSSSSRSSSSSSSSSSTCSTCSTPSPLSVPFASSTYSVPFASPVICPSSDSEEG